MTMKLNIFVIAILILVALLLSTIPAQAQTNTCRPEQVFAGATLSYTLTYGAPYYPVNSVAGASLRNIYACPISQPVQLGTQQALGFLADNEALVVWSSPDFSTYYVHRGWNVYPLTADQWRGITAVVNLKFTQDAQKRANR